MTWVESKVIYQVWRSVVMSEDYDYIGQAASLEEAKKITKDYVLKEHDRLHGYEPSFSNLDSINYVVGDNMYYMIGRRAPKLSEKEIDEKLKQFILVASKDYVFK